MLRLEYFLCVVMKAAVTLLGLILLLDATLAAEGKSGLTNLMMYTDTVNEDIKLLPLIDR